ncbi:MAG TPA: MFS transporter [Bryobacteraceae bacterium]|nr:MFS transporter [Bryobacteraceae bacterium]
MLITAAILAIFVYGMIAAMLGTILPDLSKRFNLTPKQNGTIALAQGIGLMIGSLCIGPLIDSQGFKPGLVLGLALIALALYLLPSAKGYGNIVVFLLLLGTGGGIIVTGANALAANIGGDNQAAVMNFLNLFFGLGGLATPFIAANLVRGSSTRLCYLTAILTTITLAIHASVTMPTPPAGQGLSLSTASTLLGNPALWLLCAVLFLYVSCEVGVWNWLPRHLIAQGIPEGRALNILSLGFALGLLVGRIAVAPLFGMLTPQTVLVIAGILMAVTTYFALQTRKPGVAWGAVFLAGVAMAPVFPTTLAITGGIFSATAATAIGIVATSGWVGLAVSSRIIGAVAGDDPKGLKKALLLLPAFSILMVVVTLVLRGVE